MKKLNVERAELLKDLADRLIAICRESGEAISISIQPADNPFADDEYAHISIGDTDYNLWKGREYFSDWEDGYLKYGVSMDYLKKVEVTS